MRSDSIRADIERLSGMDDHEFEDQWGSWCYDNDRDPEIMRRRWLEDLQAMLEFAEEEEPAVKRLIAAKEAYRDAPSEDTYHERTAAIEAVQEIRYRHRAARGGRMRVAGDAYVSGG